MARTAVIAGTAQAAAGSVAQSQAAKAQAVANEQAAKQATQAELADLRNQVSQLQTAPAAPAPAAPAPAAPAPAAPAPDFMAQLQQLASMKEAGLLSDDEFAAAKARLLG
jgi:hypothetical protein